MSQFMKTETLKTEIEFIGEIGLAIEERLSLSPLASRIYALLTLSSYEGLTFDEIKEITQASKSSISVNINVLIQLKYIKFYTKSSSRKRHFKVAKYFQQKYMELYHESLEKDIEMVDKINDFNKTHNPEKYVEEKSMGTITQAYFRQQQLILKETLKKMADFRDRDKSYAPY